MRIWFAVGACLALAFPTFLAAPASAQLKVDITRGVVEPIPIAVSPFAADTPGARNLGAQMAEVIAADLESSGLFDPVDPRAFIQTPDEMRTVPRFADWRQIDAQALVTGMVSEASQGAIGVEFRLWDVFAGNQMRGLRFDTVQGNWRRIAHKIADEVYERLTGDHGYFDTQIAYVSESGPLTRKEKRLAIMDQDGADHRFLTRGDELVLTPRFSPDGNRVAYIAYRGPTPSVFVRDLRSGREQSFGEAGGMGFAPRFSPDGRKLAMTLAKGGNSDIHILDIATGQRARVTRSPAIDTSPSFSPDGSRIAFNSDRAGTPQLYVANADGSGVQRISFGDGHYGSPVWSPRGDLIAFTNVKGGAFHIGVMAPDGSDERRLTRSFLDDGPSWAPNGRHLVFSRTDPATNRTRLFTIDITGRNMRELPTPLDASDPDWSPLIP